MPSQGPDQFDHIFRLATSVGISAKLEILAADQSVNTQ
jgi:hypothetical protein